MVLCDMDLLGVDVGFSEFQKSTGVAGLCEDELFFYRANSSWEDRRSQLPAQFHPSVIAIDGPLLPVGAEPRHVRPCEQFFSRGLFCRRCKPGLSHFGTGFALREAAAVTAKQFGDFVFGPNYCLGDQIVEAFPNLFLGVLVSDEDYRTIPKLRRGQKFDWLYGKVAKKLWGLSNYMILPDAVYERAEVETDHELRAGLVCLLTAGLAACKQATVAGTDDGGWFWLPPVGMWQPWAVETAEANFAGSVQALQEQR